MSTHINYEASKKLHLTNLTIIVLFSFLVYANTLGYDFVHDDVYLIVKNPWIRDVSNIINLFVSHSFSAMETVGEIPPLTNQYRPLPWIVHFLTYQVFGMSPWGFHLVNIILHAIHAVTVYFIATVFFGSSGEKGQKRVSKIIEPALLAGLIFALHPVNTESVAWISAITELAFSTFFFLSFYYYLKDRLGLSSFMFFFAVFGKETAMTLPLIMFAYDYVIRKDIHFSLKELKWLKRYMPFIVVALFYFAMRFYSLGGMAPGKDDFTDFTVFKFAVTLVVIIGKYFELLLMPVNLSAMYLSLPFDSYYDLRVITSFIFLSFLIATFIYFFRKNKKIFFFLSFIIIPLLPVFMIHKLGGTFMADRYLYIPSAGFAFLAAYGIERLTDRVSKMENTKKQISDKSLIALILIVGSLYSFGTVKRNMFWESDFTHWTESVKDDPKSEMVHYNAGLTYKKHGMIDLAKKEFLETVKLNDNFVLAHYHLGLIYGKENRFDLAEIEFKKTLKLAPNMVQVHNSLGMVYANQGDPDRARQSFERALLLKPDYEYAQKNLQKIFKIIGTRAR